MISEFLHVSHNSHHKRGTPWIQGIHAGIEHDKTCTVCGARYHRPIGDLQVSFDESKGSEWPDVLGCGARPLFIVSQWVIEAWQAEGIPEIAVGGRVLCTGTLPVRLEEVPPPEYFWIDGGRMLGAELDLAASGFVGVTYCLECNGFRNDVSATFKRRYARVCPYVFVANTYQGAQLFTTSFSESIFFCTMRMLEIARKHRLTNFKFTPVEAGVAAWSKGIDYLGKKWPPHYPLRPSEGKSLQQWIQEFRIPSGRAKAQIALVDLGIDVVPAVPELVAMWRGNDSSLRYAAAHLLGQLREHGVPLTAEGEVAAQDHADRFEGHSKTTSLE